MTLRLSRDELIEKVKALNLRLYLNVNRDLSLDRPSRDLDRFDPGYAGYGFYMDGDEVKACLWILDDDKYVFYEDYEDKDLSNHILFRGIAVKLGYPEEKLSRIISGEGDE